VTLFDQKQKPPKQKMDKHQDHTHTPVLLDAVLHYLAPRAGEAYLDVTAGYGGHAKAVLERTLNPKQAVLIDRDEKAVEALRRDFPAEGEQILHQDFLSASQKLVNDSRSFDMILADLGLNSPQVDRAERGFSFSMSGPLDMRMDQRQELNADNLVNTLDEKSLAEVLTRYGEEPKARQIARRIIAARPIGSTQELARVIGRAWPGFSRTNPATRSFQALRIAVNDELGQLSDSLPLWLNLLNPGGRMAIISFQSLEDRIVKRFFADNSGTYDTELTVLTKRPITGDATEISSNPRARSAKLRAAAKIKTKRKDRDTS
jgi:16S rRNA (cytosine1402-N4)-methyltransferase